jgi:hypothetical protein
MLLQSCKNARLPLVWLPQPNLPSIAYILVTEMRVSRATTRRFRQCFLYLWMARIFEAMTEGSDSQK